MEDEEIKETFSASYWNDKDVESRKIWSVPDNDFEKLERGFAKKKLLGQFELIAEDNHIAFRDATGASLASGVCVLESHILRKYPAIKKLYCVEFSRHRIVDMAPKILAHYEIEEERAELCLGSFYDLRFEKNRFDFMILCQAFHHASDVNKLLSEIKRVLKPSGIVFIVGEHYFNTTAIAKRALKYMAKWVLNHKGQRDKSSFLPTWNALFPIDHVKGDHHYSRDEYKRMFNGAGFNFRRYIFKDVKNQGFILKLQSNQP